MKRKQMGELITGLVVFLAFTGVLGSAVVKDAAQKQAGAEKPAAVAQQ